MKMSLIVTIYKNQNNIEPFYEDFCSNIRPYIDDYELIFVNDASPDGSWEVLKQLSKRDKKIRLIRLSRNYGEPAAVFSGIECATGDCIAVKACDLQEPAQLTLDMYAKWKEGAEIVIATRESRGDSWISKFFSNMYYHLVRKLVAPNMPKGGFDIYLFDKRIACLIKEMKDKNSPITLQLLWLDFDFCMVSYKRKKREVGKSSWSFAKKAKLFTDSFIGFSYIPIRIMSVVGLIFALFAAVYGIWNIIDRLRGEIPVQGYTTIFVLVLFSSGLIMFTLGILGEYIWRTLDASRNRPIAVVAEKIGFDGEQMDDH